MLNCNSTVQTRDLLGGELSNRFNESFINQWLYRYSSLLKIIVFLGAACLFAICFASQAGIGSSNATAIPVFGYKVIQSYPHDTLAFTQGLKYEDGRLYEGTGLYGKSTLRKVNLTTGQVIKEIDLPEDQFGEGIAIWHGYVVQLTWQSGIGHVFDKFNFTPIKDFRYSTEGWGITSDGKELIMSDGTDKLYFLSPENFSVIGQVSVKSNGVPLRGLNELEYIKGKVYANLWPTDWIAIISPSNGEVEGYINLTNLLQTYVGPKARVKTDVLNGIAYDDKGERIFVTGKLWPRLFEIDIVPGLNQNDAFDFSSQKRFNY